MWVFFYQLLWHCLRLVFSSVAHFFPAHRSQLDRSPFDTEQLKALRSVRAAKTNAAIFFCSSAGEYEQAKPVAKRFVEERDGFVLFVMGSASGVRFAQAQGEQAPFFLSPWDQPEQWQGLYEAIKPNFTVIVRYELWPAFLRYASHAGPVYLIDAVQSESLRRSGLSRWAWRQLLKRISHIFVVGEEDRQFYKSYLARDERDLSLVGDTKYDRVLERIDERAERRQNMTQALAAFIQGRRLLLIGSAWPEDVAALVGILPKLREFDPLLKFIIAPHDVSDDMARKIISAFAATGLSLCRTSQSGLASAKAQDEILLVDEIGLLPELYALADVAWVGGAMHYRVHNVLEPSCWGLYVCFGPKYQTSQEARALVAQGLAQVIRGGEDFLEWYKTLALGKKPPHVTLWKAVEAARGASQRILDRVYGELGI